MGKHESDIRKIEMLCQLLASIDCSVQVMTRAECEKEKAENRNYLTYGCK